MERNHLQVSIRSRTKGALNRTIRMQRFCLAALVIFSLTIKSTAQESKETLYEYSQRKGIPIRFESEFADRDFLLDTSTYSVQFAAWEKPTAAECSNQTNRLKDAGLDDLGIFREVHDGKICRLLLGRFIGAHTLIAIEAILTTRGLSYNKDFVFYRHSDSGHNLEASTVPMGRGAIQLAAADVPDAKKIWLVPGDVQSFILRGSDGWFRTLLYPFSTASSLYAPLKTLHQIPALLDAFIVNNIVQLY